MNGRTPKGNRLSLTRQESMYITHFDYSVGKDN
jgi:hypothetical protein